MKLRSSFDDIKKAKAESDQTSSMYIQHLSNDVITAIDSAADKELVDSKFPPNTSVNINTLESPSTKRRAASRSKSTENRVDLKYTQTPKRCDDTNKASDIKSSLNSKSIKTRDQSKDETGVSDVGSKIKTLDVRLDGTSKAASVANIKQSNRPSMPVCLNLATHFNEQNISRQKDDTTWTCSVRKTSTDSLIDKLQHKKSPSSTGAIYAPGNYQRERPSLDLETVTETETLTDFEGAQKRSELKLTIRTHESSTRSQDHWSNSSSSDEDSDDSSSSSSNSSGREDQNDAEENGGGRGNDPESSSGESTGSESETECKSTANVEKVKVPVRKHCVVKSDAVNHEQEASGRVKWSGESTTSSAANHAKKEEDEEENEEELEMETVGGNKMENNFKITYHVP